MSSREKERIQFISFDSIKANFHKVFGVSNDAVAEMLFRYMIDSRNEPATARFKTDCNNGLPVYR